ncbi:MAG: DUF1972 domain-containing protein [Saprospiraceae bacterium]|nr:DUF1972 domain-containing protein [Saprospiraceae bacterium]
MHIAILGTRGIPNQYGGFEQFAEKLSVGLVDLGCQVTVYNPTHHTFTENSWKAVNIINQKDPVKTLKSAGQFVYDLNCIRDSRKHDFDIIYQLGYTSSSIWFRLHSKSSILVTNMDGIEWKRVKYNSVISNFLKFAEKLAVKKSDYLIADSVEIKKYLNEKYNVDSNYIPYGAEIFQNPDTSVLSQFNILPFQYYLLIARFQPDNNIETIIKGFLLSDNKFPLILIGNYKNSYGNYLKKKYTDKRLVFSGSVFDKNILDNLRFHAKLYFHGHSSGGTNPSLLEAMGCKSLICSHDNAFNKEVVGKNGYFFSSENDISMIIKSNPDKSEHQIWIENNLNKIKSEYNWNQIIETYYNFFQKIINK